MDRGDEWEKDPSVQAMRGVFRRMEKEQEAFLNRLGISPFDTRLRGWRERALVIFENSWGRAGKLGMSMNQESAGVLYVHALYRVMLSDGAEVPSAALPEGKDSDHFLKAVLP